MECLFDTRFKSDPEASRPLPFMVSSSPGEAKKLNPEPKLACSNNKVYSTSIDKTATIAGNPKRISYNYSSPCSNYFGYS